MAVGRIKWVEWNKKRRPSRASWRGRGSVSRSGLTSATRSRTYTFTVGVDNVGTSTFTVTRDTTPPEVRAQQLLLDTSSFPSTKHAYLLKM